MSKELTEDKDLHQGPHLDDVVGDDRRIRIRCFLPKNTEETNNLGEAWQDQAGNLFGTGLPSVMLYEPEMSSRYRQAAHAANVSPLTIMFERVSGSAWYVPDFIEERDDEE